MRSSNEFYYRSKRIQTIYRKLKNIPNIQYWFLPFKELLIEDIKLVQPHLQRSMTQSLYGFVLMYLCLSFCVIGNDSLASRIGFIVRVLLVIVKLPPVSHRWNIKTIQSQVILDSFVSSVVNVLLGVITPEQYITDNTFLGLIQAFLPFSFTIKCISVIIITFINLVLFSNTTNINHILMGSFLHCYGIVMAYYSGFMINMLFKKLIENQEKVQQEVKNKSMFVASISHDLKNPLNSLLGCLDLLKNSMNLTEKDKCYIATASYSGQIMTYLIGNIIDSSKIEAGRFDIDKLPMDIEIEVEKILLIEKELAKKKGISMYKKVLTPLPKLVYGDAMRFSQILINILGNAIKFVSKGYIGIILSWASSIDKAKTKNDHFIPPEEYFSLENSNERLIKIEKREDYEEKEFQELPVPVSESISKYSEMSPSMRSTRKLHRIGSPVKLYCAKASPTSYMDQSKVIDKFPGPVQSTDSNSSLFSIAKKENVKPYESKVSGTKKSEVYEKTVIEDSGILVIDIIDTGIGMSEEEQKRLFKPFNQANSSVKAKYGGTGLGLWITKQLVYLMSGFIELKSKPQKGSRFTITLPFKVVKNEDSIIKVSEESKTPKADKIDIRSFNGPSEVINNLRKNKKLAFTGNDKSLYKMSILLIEDTMENSLIEQVITQLQGTDCRLSYATYNTTLEVLKEEKYNFNTIVIISAEQKAQTMKMVVSIMKDIKDAGYKQMPICVISSNKKY